MLAGMVKAPSRYNPLSDPKRATDRAKQVLASMVDAGYMTDADASRAIAQGVANLRPPQSASGQYYADWVLDQVSDYVNYADRDLVVVTTIDGRAEQIAEAVIDQDARRCRCGQECRTRRPWSPCRPMARCAPWWAGATMAPASSTAPPRRCARRDRPSSSSSIWRRWKRA